MKTIVNNLLCDTESSELLYCDFKSYTSIYLTRNGRLFMMEWDDVSVTDQEECKTYLAKVFPDKYMELFGGVEEA